jgi:hypothetical protein
MSEMSHRLPLVRSARRASVLARLARVAAPVLLSMLVAAMPVLATRAGAQPRTGPMATTPPVPKGGLRLPDIQLHDPWIVADQKSRTY